MKTDHERFERYLEGQLSAEETAKFDAALQADDALRAEFSSYLAMHGELLVDAETLLSDEPETPSLSWRAPLLGLAATLILGAGIAVGQFGKQEPTTPVATVATLVDARASQWGSGTLPTAIDSRLAPGRLELTEGLATLQFDEGASITLEAPATIEILSAARCRLIDGAAVAWVPDGAEGFQIETADALVTDYGTRFGITSDAGEGSSEVLVLEGEVGVDHYRDEAPEQRLVTGEIVRYDGNQLLLKGAADPSETERGHNREGKDGWTEIKAAKDSFVRNSHLKNSGTGPLIMVKHSTGFPGNQRKGYLGFSGGELPAEFSNAELVLSIQASGMGYASVVPDAHFTVYGLSNADWEESMIEWANAPENNVNTGNSLRTGQVVELGDFTVEQGVASGTVGISGAALLDFVRTNREGDFTFIVVRDTDENDRHGLVHAFASRDHPSAPAPVLRVR